MKLNLYNIEKSITYLLVFSLPLFILPIFPNFFITDKLILATALTMVILVLKSVRVIKSGTIKIHLTNFDFPILFLVAAFIGSAIVNTPNKYEAFFVPGTASIFVLGAILYLILNQLNEKSQKLIIITIITSGTIISIVSLIAAAGILAEFKALPAWAKDPGFTLLGGVLPAIMYLIPIIPMEINLLTKETDVAKKVLYGITSAIIVFAIVVSVLQILPGKPGAIKMPSLNTSWVVAIDSLKEKPILGMGPGNYLTAFNRFRPISYNQTNLWQMRFNTARNIYLSIITETGLLGLTAIILLGYLIFKSTSLKNKNPNIIPLFVLIVLLAIFPATIMTIILLFILLSLNSKGREINIGTFSSQDHKDDLIAKLPIIITTLPVFVFILAVAFLGIKTVNAEYKYKKALDFVTAGNGSQAYNYLQQALKTNPKVDRYHISYAQLNLALADSIARKEKPTDEDRNTITQLIQESIQAGKNGVSLNTTRAENWTALAQIYNTIRPMAENSDQFAIQTYTQAINLDPINPQLRIALGNIYYSNKDYENAARILELAVMTKPDFANAHYNLAFVYKDAGQLDKAINSMTTTLSLVDRKSKDYEVAKQALEDLENRKKQATKSEGESLTSPTQDKQVLNPPIELPENSQPPKTATPTPAPTPLP